MDYQKFPYKPKLLAIAVDKNTQQAVIGGDHGALQYFSNITENQKPQVLAEIRANVMHSFLFSGHEKSKDYLDNQQQFINSTVTAIIFANQGKQFFTGDVYGKIILWDINSNGRYYPTLIAKDSSFPVMSLAPDSSGHGIFASFMDGSVGYYDVTKGDQDGKPISSVKFSATIRDIAFHNNRDHLLVGADDGYVYTIKSQAGRLVVKTEFKIPSSILGVSFSPLGNTIGIATLSGVFLLQDYNNPKNNNPLPEKLIQSEGAANNVTWSPNGQLIASAYNDGYIKIWVMSDLKSPPIWIKAHSASARRAVFVNDELIASVGFDGNTQLTVISPKLIADRICDMVWRDLSEEEWHYFVGNGMPSYEQCTPSPLFR